VGQASGMSQLERIKSRLCYVQHAAPRRTPRDSKAPNCKVADLRLTLSLKMVWKL